jgi:FO synthase subunit 1
MHERYGHVQEVMVQQVVENERWTRGSPSLETMRRVTAMARRARPGEVSVQSPPNLGPSPRPARLRGGRPRRRLPRH